MSDAAAGDARGFPDRRRQATRGRTRELLAETTRLQRAVATLAHERCVLQEQLRRERGEREQLLELQAQLRAALLAAEERGALVREDYRAIERQNWALANLYVACHRLHARLDRAGVLRTIEDILVNLVGAAQTAVFERSGTQLLLVHSSGIDGSRYERVRLGEGPIGRCGASGRTFLAGPRGLCERSADDPEVTACVPIWFEARVTGVVAVLRLLPQKSELEDIDHELLELLSTHAGSALHFASLHGLPGIASRLA